jgi:hypothetical protein
VIERTEGGKNGILNILPAGLNSVIVMSIIGDESQMDTK